MGKSYFKHHKGTDVKDSDWHLQGEGMQGNRVGEHLNLESTGPVGWGQEVIYRWVLHYWAP